MRILIILFLIMASGLGVHAETHTSLSENSVDESVALAMTDPPRPARVNFPETVCFEDWNNVVLELYDEEPGVTYTWQIPAQYSSFVTESADGKTVTIQDMTGYNEAFPIAILARNSCGFTPRSLIINKVTALDIPTIDIDTVCTGDSYMVSPLSAPRVREYNWDFGPGGKVASGDETTGEPFSISFDNQGLQSYMLTITDTDGCEHVQRYELVVYDAPPSPNLQCDDTLNGEVLIDWTQDPNPIYTYTMDFSNMPTTLTWTQVTDTQLRVTGFSSPCQYALLGIIVEGPNPAPCNSKRETIPCRPSPKPSIVFDHSTNNVNFCIGDPVTVVTLGTVVNGTPNPGSGRWIHDDPAAPVPGYSFSGTGGTFDPTGLAAGIYPATYEYTNPLDNCLETAQNAFVVHERPTPNATLGDDPNVVITSTEICADSFIVFNYSIYDDIPGPNISVSPQASIDIENTSETSRTIHFPNQDENYTIQLEYSIPGCDPVRESLSVQVNARPDLMLMCGDEQTDYIDLEWSNVGGSTEIFLNGTSKGTSQNGEFKIENLQTDRPYDIIIETNTLTCGIVRDTAECRTSNCMPPTVDYGNTVDPVCWNPLDGFFNLGVSITTPTGGTMTWQDPTLVDNNLFIGADPLQTNYVLVANYEDTNGCTFDVDIPLTYYTQPNPFLEASNDTICIGSGNVMVESKFVTLSTSVVYELNTLPAGVTNEGGSDAGPYEFSFAAPGSYDISMDITVDGVCKGKPDTVTIVVLEEPELRLACGLQAEDAVTLVWEDLGLTYEVTEGGTVVGSTDSPTIEISGLTANQTFDFVVTAEDPNCGTITDMIQCVTVACIPPDVTDNVRDTICYDPAGGPYTLDVDIQSASGAPNGTYTWDTNLVEDGTNIFTPDNLIEDYSLDAVYTDDDGCSSRHTVEFTLVQPPVIQLALASSDEVCIAGGQIEIFGEFQGQNVNAVEFVTDFPDEADDVEVSPGRYILTFDQPGVYSLGMSVDYYECPGETEYIDVTITDVPDLGLDCGPSTNTSITLEFNDLGTDFQIFQDEASIGLHTGSELLVENLEKSKAYDFLIQTLDPDCGLIEDSITCTTFVCLRADIDLSQIDSDICHDSTLGGYELLVAVTNADPAIEGRVEWDSPYVDDEGIFTPDPAVVDYLLPATYIDDNSCRQDTFVEFSYTERPKPTLVLMGNDTICEEGGVITFMSEYLAADMTLVTYEVEDLLPAGASIVSGNGAGPYEIKFDSDGVFDLGMIVNNNGCKNDVPETVEVVVQPAIDDLLLSATPDYGAIILEWEPLNCVSTYKVLDEQGTFLENVTGTSTTITGLEELTEYTFIIEPVSNCLCEASIAMTTETTLECPAVTIIVTDIDTCYNPSLPAFAIPVDTMTSGLISGGMGLWSGDLIDIDGLVDVTRADGPETYEMTYTYTEASCVHEKISLVTFHAEPTLEVEALSPACIDDEMGMVIVSVDGGAPDYSYALDGGMPQASNTFDMVPVGNFEIAVADGNGCIVSEIHQLEDSTDPSLEIMGLDLVVEANDADYDLVISDLDLQDVVNITWYYNGIEVCNGPTCTELTLIKLDQGGELLVELEYGDGCIIPATKQVDINEVNAVYIPNMVDWSGSALPPDNEWKAFVKGSESFITSVQVFDRWGNMVQDYENKSMDYFKEFLIWDGFFGSEPAAQGIYTYKIVLLIEGNTEIKHGNVTVLR